MEALLGHRKTEDTLKEKAHNASMSKARGEKAAH